MHALIRPLVALSACTLILLGGRLALAAESPVAAPAETPALPRSPAPAGASLYFISPKAGAIVAPTFTVRFGLRGMGVAPAGIERDNTGHHHILIDVAELPPMDLPLPASENIVHFGAGQTETQLTLKPGTHTLQLVLGNHLHIPHDPPVVSDKITITVREGQ
ncbi:MAG: DUF4399 domain-containing protein [Gammaproteobacteria bacterium]